MRRIIVCCLLIALALPAAIMAEDSQCVACHTSGRTLISVVREIEAEIGDEPTESTESVGEG